MTRISIKMDSNNKEGEEGDNRLAGLITEFALEQPKVDLDLRDSPTLIHALPKLLQEAYKEADRIIAEEKDCGLPGKERV